MLRKKWLGLLVVLGGLLLGAGVVLMFWAQQLAPGEAAVVGTWITPPQPPDGFSTALLLRPDRTCRVRWLDRVGKDNQTPREGRW